MTLRACCLQLTAFNGDPVHLATESLVVILRIVPGRSVVPECDRPGLPVEPGDVFCFCCLAVKELKERLRFLVSPAFDTKSKSRVDVQRFSATQGMFDNHWVGRLIETIRRFRIVNAPAKFSLTAGLAAEDMVRRMNRAQLL